MHAGSRDKKQQRNNSHSSLLAIAISLVLCPLTGTADDRILWPSRGLFPAYSMSESEHGLRPYAFIAAGYDDNLFRLSHDVEPVVVDDDGNLMEDPSRGDGFLMTGAGVRADLDWRRQELQLDVVGSRSFFDEYSLLDEWLFSGNAQWLWQVGDHLDGRVGYSYSRTYPEFSDLQVATDDLVTNQYGQFGIDWRMLARLELRLLAEASRYEHEDPALAESDHRVESGTAGLFYVSPTNTSIGVQYKASEGEYPNRQTVDDLLIDNNYSENESSLAITKPFEVNLELDLRVGYTRREHEEVPQRDFGGTTGHVRLRYAPTAKTSVQLAVYRELSVVEELSASYAVAEGASIGPAWAPTSKIVVQAYYMYEERVLSGDPGVVIDDTPPREDRTHAGRLIGGYEPNDNIRVSITYEHGWRSSNVATADYDYNLVLLNLTLSM